MPWETRKVRYADKNGKHEKSERREERSGGQCISSVLVLVCISVFNVVLV